MSRKYALKRAFGNRYALTAVLFLAITLWGSVTALLGALELKTACQGFAPPRAEAQLVKADPTLPHRDLSSPGSRLDRPQPAEPWYDRAAEKTAAAETLVTQALEDQHGLIQLFGGFQRFTDRTVVEDPASPQYAVARLEDGSLTFVGTGRADADAQAAQLKRLQTALDQRGVALLYAQAPSKLEPGAEGLPYGLSDPSNDCADALLERLEELGVDCLDLRETLKRAGGRWTDWFYRTDHHWRQAAAFTAFQDLAGRLEDYWQTRTVAGGTRRERIVIDPRYTDPGSYSTVTLPRYFLGSQGKRVGSLYAGTDDFELWTPNFPTLLHYDAPPKGRYGSAEETLLFPERVEEADWFGGNPYTYYAGGDYGYARIINYYNPRGPKVLLIRDSYACALTPYLAYATSQLTTIDPRYFSGDLLRYVDSLKPDAVVILYSSGMVRSEQYYRLLRQPSAPAKSDSLRWKTDWLQEEKPK